MRKDDTVRSTTGRLVALIAIFVFALGWLVSPHAQSVWNDVRHEITVRNDPQSFVCSVVNNSGTGLTAFGGSCVGATLPAGQAMYITDITASASVIATTTADQYLEIKSGTGTTCGTGTAVVWSAYNLAFAPIHASFNTPIKVGSNADLCWMHAATGSKTFIVTGYIK